MRMTVKVSDRLDRLVITSPDVVSLANIKQIIADSSPGVKIQQSAEGLSILAQDVAKVDFNIEGINVAFTELAEKFLHNRKRVSENFEQIIGQIKGIKTGGSAIAKKYLEKIINFEVLDDHQLVNVACMTLPDGFGLCVFDEQGAGKTVTLIFAYDVLVEKDEVDFVLIVAPKSMVPEWPVDFEKFMPGRYKVATLVGSYFDKAKVLSNNADVLVTNFETVVSMEDELRALIRRHGSRAMLVVDESFFAKNLDARRTQSIRRLREFCGRAYVLCGTPAPNSPHDIVEQFNIVDFGMTFNDVDIPKDKAQASKIIKNAIEEGPYVRNLKKDVMPELSPKSFHRVHLQMEKEQRQLYLNTLKGLVSDLNLTDDNSFEKNKLSFLARRSALLQICSTPSSIQPGLEEIPCKLIALDQILHDLIDVKSEKVILWSFYTDTLETLFGRYQQYNPVRYDGTISDTNLRRKAVRSFKEDDETKLFIGNPAAAGAGLNLQSARYAIYESMSNQAAHYLQSLDRIHRRGQDRDVQYIVLLCEDTIEVPNYERLIQKELAAQEMLSDGITHAVTREGLLAELLL